MTEAQKHFNRRQIPARDLTPQERAWIQECLSPFVIVVALLILQSCHGVDLGELQFTRRQPSKADLIGKWVPTPKSLREMKERDGLTISKHELDLHADGSFSATNMSDWWGDFGGESRMILQSGLGAWDTWDIQSVNDGFTVWVINLDFLNRHRVPLHLRRQNPPYLIYIYVGDPDSGGAILLERTH
jgi:hypothetical protein